MACTSCNKKNKIPQNVKTVRIKKSEYSKPQVVKVVSYKKK